MILPLPSLGGKGAVAGATKDERGKGEGKERGHHRGKERLGWDMEVTGAEGKWVGRGG